MGTAAQANFHLVESHQPSSSSAVSSLVPQKCYNGGYPDAKNVLLRIGNGGAGQSGLVGAFADAFIQAMVESKFVAEPFKVEWYLGDTTQSLSYLAAGYIDVALTYNAAAEKAAVKSGDAVERELVFLDHFYLVGPKCNPAKLCEKNDTVSDMFNKLVTCGNADTVVPPDPSVRPPTRFLSRFDKSATNIKESELFIKIGQQVPWALAYSSWYHQYPRFPLQALQAAAVLSEYTLTDKGTWLSSPKEVTDSDKLKIYKEGTDPSSTDGSILGSDDDDGAILLNPCSALLGQPEKALSKEVAKKFMEWLVDLEGGQKVVVNFKKNGEVLYTPAVKSK
ncbi:hypothetical protein K435DRAFT_695197 [Dendrothele bispora CBS 962.96]|uniref:PBP domain-containing protein n=1 Tax=Dendrothele bispora (strain CBS 962.96) TaxID=1314807 RepID=A0A4S8KXP0_DENBC|nr:hypothetical protein K435DRAFT_695197 [Dendrothele bispora CBS 962.96]